MSDGKGGGGGSVVVSYKYHMGVHLIATHGPVDSVNRFIFGEREAWSGSITDSATIEINKPQLFGGDDREGGVVGSVDVLMGGDTQPRNPYLAAKQGANCSAYRGLLSFVFRGLPSKVMASGVGGWLQYVASVAPKSFMWASGNPYFKAPWVEITRRAKGWQNDTPWNVADIAIGTYDMNPAHIIYQAMTDPAFGMGYTPADMDDANWRAAATQLKIEGFGLSMEWKDDQAIENFIQDVLNHINGAIGVDLATGKWQIKLIRGDYSLDSLLQLDETNIIEIVDFQRAAIGDAPNEVVVIYRDRDENDKPVTVQNLAMVNAQGAVISTTRQYPGIRSDNLAFKVAMRDLATLSSPLASLELTTNRVLWDKEKGDVVKVVLPDSPFGMAGVAFRIVDINKGSLTESTIRVKLIEDVFGLPTSNYTAVANSNWTDTLVPPLAVDVSEAMEVPYYEVARRMTLADRAQLQADYGFGMLLVGRGATRSALNYVLSASSDNVTFDDLTTGHFNPTATLANNITPGQTSIALSGAYDLDKVVLSADGGYAWIGGELVSVISVDPETGAAEIGRGILDTVPSSHVAGTRVYFIVPQGGYDQREHVAGETVYYKPRPTTGLGVLPLDDAAVDSLVFNNRASRPYPPGNVKINGAAYPANIAGPAVTVTWSHRDRVAQTAGFIDTTVGNIGPEPGVTYRLRLYNGLTLKRTYEIAGSATSWTYPTDDSIADGNLAALRIQLVSVRDGLESWSAHDWSFTRATVTGGSYVDSKPAQPSLQATGVDLGISWDWLFGDTRTNIDKTELWISETPNFADGRPVHYENYPSNHWVQDLGEIGAIRWGWCRVLDNNGLMSDWSAPVAVAQSTIIITGTEIADDSITTPKLVAGAVVASKMSVAQLSAITGNMGHLTAGDITLDSAGFIRGGQTAYNTGNGFWLGYEVDSYKFSIGNGTRGLRWDGTDLFLRGGLLAGDFTGYAWPAAGGTGAYFGEFGLLFGNPNPSAGNPLGKYFQLYAPVGGVPQIVTNIPAYLEDLQVTTIKIGQNAVSVPLFIQSAGPYNAPVIFHVNGSNYFWETPTLFNFDVPAVALGQPIKVIMSFKAGFARTLLSAQQDSIEINYDTGAGLTGTISTLVQVRRNGNVIPVKFQKVVSKYELVTATDGTKNLVESEFKYQVIFQDTPSSAGLQQYTVGFDILANGYGANANYYRCIYDVTVDATFVKR